MTTASDRTVSLNDLARDRFTASEAARAAYRHWIVDVYEARCIAAAIVLPLFEAFIPNDQRPREAVEAGMALFASVRAAVDDGSPEPLTDMDRELYVDRWHAAEMAAFDAQGVIERRRYRPGIQVVYASAAAVDAVHAARAAAVCAVNPGIVVCRDSDRNGVFGAFGDEWAASAACTDGHAFAIAFDAWCRGRLQARLQGDDVPPVSECPGLTAALDILRAEVARRESIIRLHLS